MDDGREGGSCPGSRRRPAFRVRNVTVAPDRSRAYDAREWRDAIVVVARGEIELEDAGGNRRRFGRGAILGLAGLPLRALHNRGRKPAVLVAVSRRRHRPSDEFRAGPPSHEGAAGRRAATRRRPGALAEERLREAITESREDPPMPIGKVLAAVPVADIGAAHAWYERLLGRPADDVPMGEAAEWHVTAGGSIQVVLDAERAGSGMVTLAVDDMDEQVAVLAARGLTLAAVDAASGMFRIATIADPEGNAITFAQDLGGR